MISSAKSKPRCNSRDVDGSGSSDIKKPNLMAASFILKESSARYLNRRYEDDTPWRKAGTEQQLLTDMRRCRQRRRRRRRRNNFNDVFFLGDGKSCMTAIKDKEVKKQSKRDTRSGNKLDLKSELQGERWTCKLEETFNLICNHKLYPTAAWDICNSKFEKCQSYYV